MTTRTNLLKVLCFLLSTTYLNEITAQVYSYSSDNNKTICRVIMNDSYLVETKYNAASSKFIATKGGFYTKRGNQISVALEFNSTYEADKIKTLTLNFNDFTKISKEAQPLKGKWLMAGRVIDGKERRRSGTSTRKTMKFLVDGFFQWTAFGTNNFSFFGAGGGTYKANDGQYTEAIDYFSRDDTKAGLRLIFNYQLKGNDWYHKGFSSSGQPLHEIWTKRADE